MEQGRTDPSGWPDSGRERSPLGDPPAIGRLGDLEPEQPSTAERVLATLWKRRLSFAIAFVATLAAAAIVTFSLPKVYSTRSFILVTPTQQAGSDFSAVQYAQTLSKTYAELLQTPAAANAVARELPFPESGGSLSNSVSVSPVSDSQLLEIEAEDGDPARAREIANTYASVSVDRANTLSEEGFASARLTVADEATLPSDPVRPNPPLYLLVGVVLAAFVAAGVALLRERLSQQLDIDAATTRLFGLPVLARIPKSRPLSILVTEPDSLAARVLGEPFRLLHANLNFVSFNQRPFSIAVLSSDKAEGKSLCAASLARVAAEFEGSTLLVDADLRLRTLSSRVGAENAPEGLSTALAGRTSDSLAAISRPVAGSRLRLLPAGPTPPNPGVLLSTDALSEFDRRARQEFDLVIYDTPPLSVGADASFVAARAGGVVLVVDAERTRRRTAVQAVDQLERAQARVLGVVINRAPGSVATYGPYYGRVPEELASPREGARRSRPPEVPRRERRPSVEERG